MGTDLTPRVPLRHTWPDGAWSELHLEVKHGGLRLEISTSTDGFEKITLSPAQVAAMMDAIAVQAFPLLDIAGEWREAASAPTPEPLPTIVGPGYYALGSTEAGDDLDRIAERAGRARGIRENPTPASGRGCFTSCTEGRTMAADQNWREAGQGIPVWLGCREMDGGIVVGFTDDGIIRKIDGAMVGTCHPATSGPDLADPDTRAAYDRRLALELGAPEEAVNEGVCI